MVKVAKNKAAIITILLGLRGPSMRQRGGLNLDRPPLRSRPGPGCRSAKEGATESRWASILYSAGLRTCSRHKQSTRGVSLCSRVGVKCPHIDYG